MITHTITNNDEYIDKAKSLISAIENKIGFDVKTGLIKDLFTTSTPNIDTFENLALSIAYILDQRIEKGVNLLTGVISQIGFDKRTQLIKNKFGSNNIFASDNLLLGVEYSLLGSTSKATEQIARIENHIGYDSKTRMLRNGFGREEIYPFNSLLLAICYYMNGEILKANAIFEEIINNVFFDSTIHLIAGCAGRKNYKSKTSYFTFDNSLLSILFFLLGEKEKSQQTLKAVEEKIGFHSSGLVRRSTDDGRLYTYVNGILAVTYQVLGGNSTHTYVSPRVNQTDNKWEGYNGGCLDCL